MRRDLVYRDEIMDSLVKEYNRKRTNDGLKLAWIEKAVNDVKPAQIDLPDNNVGDMISRSSLLAKYDKEHEGPPGRARKLIEEEPPIQPASCSEFPNNSDTISRQAAIEADRMFEREVEG